MANQPGSPAAEPCQYPQFGKKAASKGEEQIEPRGSESATPRPFDGYRVQPVVETTAPDGVERNYERFMTLPEAQAETNSFNANSVFEGSERQQILWSLYGLRHGVAEHIGDRLTEDEAFSLLYSISGVPGISGQTDYPRPPLWIITHSHRHGTDAWAVSSEAEPTETQLVRCLEIDYEPSREEFIEIHSIDDVTRLDWQEGDDAVFSESED